MLPTFMLQQGWSEGQKSGNQVNYRRRLADKSERKGEKVGIIRRLFFFFLIIWVNGAGPLQQAGSDPATCFVGSVVTLLTRSVLTQTSLSSTTNTWFSLGVFFSAVLFPAVASHASVHTCEFPNRSFVFYLCPYNWWYRKDAAKQGIYLFFI